MMEHVVDGLESEFRVTLIGPSGCGDYCPEGMKVYECPSNAFSFLVLAMIKGLFVCLRDRYALVLGGSGLVSPVTAFLGMIRGARNAVFVHGLDLVVANRLYQAIFVPAIRRHDLVIANSSNTRKLALEKGCDGDRVDVLHPGTEMPVPLSPELEAEQREKLNLAGRKVCLFVGRMIRRKGLAEFLEKAWPGIHDQVEGALLLVVGDSPEDA